MVVAIFDLTTNDTLLYAATAIIASVAVLLWQRARRRTPDELERLRRLHINEVGRIAGGEVIDILDGAGSGRAQRVIVYHYEVNGVAYEASQDVTSIADRLAPGACLPGLPVNIKYDPANAGNSILICENWSGVTPNKSASRVG
jgi:hypothetical protein